MDAIAIIPARIASTRLPRKVLREIAGKTMLERVVSAALDCKQLREVIVATDSDEVLVVCKKHGWKAQMTRPDHRSGTDRVHEVAQSIAAEIYVNVQGDEPLARPEHLDALLSPFFGVHGKDVEVATIATPCKPEDFDNPNAVKVVTDEASRALYFSRSTIPHDRDGLIARSEASAYARKKHLGFYAYRKSALDRFCTWPESALERTERLEQLRFLDHGVAIHVAMTPHDTIGVDTEDDLRRVESLIRAREKS